MSEAAIAAEVRALREAVESLIREVRSGGPEYLTVPKLMKRYGYSRAELKRRFQTGRLPGVEYSTRNGHLAFKVEREVAERLLRKGGGR